MEEKTMVVAETTDGSTYVVNEGTGGQETKPKSGIEAHKQSVKESEA